MSGVPAVFKTWKKNGEEQPLHDYSFSRKLKDAGAGFVGGVSQVLIGQPLDLIKVLIQTGQYKNPYEAFTATMAKEGPLAFYKGAAVPLVGVGCINTIMFNFCYAARRKIIEMNPGQTELKLSQYFIAGSIAGTLTAFITSPVEQIRILLQAQPLENKLYKGPIDCFQKIRHQNGFGLNGMFRGLGMTIFRDAPAHGVWFCTYEFLMRDACARRNCKRDDVPTWQLLLYGAIAGDALWLISYPMDVVKTIQQNDRFGKDSKYRTCAQVATRLYQTQGFRGFWIGLTPALIRAAPVNAGVFASVELALRVLG
ncbi:hypothetical protein PACTADRAFT_50052 [Pachysolen tannophilus NRRL Y-2460]|uniref:Mitochondrial carrier protein n=1 Tax=Pachysolen tannophilus NRRL Y-2460 TaxID=669874 RepID=A0A1E4TU77_PACTA|nr:hypothetical protein PACTADRAFT_50052 [Pachysolen tannophilus NRRL Y-2460]